MAKKQGSNKLLIPWLYDLVLWMLSVLIDLFFREVHPRGAWRVPKKGPIILVAAPHANQVWQAFFRHDYHSDHNSSSILSSSCESSRKKQGDAYRS
jgi:hypothetical protein